MNRQELVAAAQEASGVDVAISDVDAILEALLIVVTESLKAQQRVILRGHFSLDTYEAKSRPARNLVSGETVVIPPTRRIKLKPSPKLIDQINEEP